MSGFVPLLGVDLVMKMSTRGRYGLRALFDIAQRYGSGSVVLKTIAMRQNLSELYLEQLFAVMRRAGIVASVRGPQGGYVLARSPEEITVGEVLRVLEGHVGPTDCIDPNICAQSGTCPTRAVWLRMNEALCAVVDNMTLQDLVDNNGAGIPQAKFEVSR